MRRHVLIRRLPLGTTRPCRRAERTTGVFPTATVLQPGSSLPDSSLRQIVRRLPALAGGTAAQLLHHMVHHDDPASGHVDADARGELSVASLTDMG